MDMITLISIGGAVLFGALYFARRRSRTNSDKFD